jgi:hypothetical protein
MVKLIHRLSNFSKAALNFNAAWHQLSSNQVNEKKSEERYGYDKETGSH